jgi:hypothetical protein
MIKTITASFCMLALIAMGCGGGGGGGNQDTPSDPGAEVKDVVEAAPLDPGQDKPPEDVPPVDNPPVDQTPVDPGPKDNPPVDTAPSCPLAIYTGPNCNEFAACALQCSDSDYETKCLAKADAGQKDAYTKVKDCLKVAGCDSVFEQFSFTKCATDKPSSRPVSRARRSAWTSASA